MVWVLVRNSTSTSPAPSAVKRVEEESGVKHVDLLIRFGEACGVTREQVLRVGLSELADRVCDGTASPLVHALVQGSKFSPEDIAHFRKLLDELERKE